jgi:hypothetical protein
MITRRVTTKMPAEPPVRFYRTIALSFLILTITLLGVVIFFTSKKATIVIAAKSDNKNVNLLIDIGKQAGSSTISGEVTSTVFKWSEKYYPTGNKVEDGVAMGELIIYNKSNEDQPLVQTTRLVTADGILFRLSNNEYVPAGGNITAKVYADKSGVTGDIDPSKFTIPGLSTDRQKLVYAESSKKMSGGVKKVGMLTNDDLSAAKSDFISKAKQAYLTSASSSNAGKNIVVDVKSDNITSDQLAGATISEFTLSGSNSVVLVSYNNTELQTMINKEITKGIDVDSEKVLSVGGAPQVKLSSYDLVNGTSRLSVYQDVLVTLDANGTKLSAVNFFGEKKDDITRYVMGLGHVIGVDVQFAPSWMRAAPRVTDKIKVVVKNVK